jgi:hypothetical protein
MTNNRYVGREGELREAKPGKGRDAFNGVVSALKWQYSAGLKPAAEM